MRVYVGITDHDWYQFLSARPAIDEVNFWQPSGSRAFRVLQPGEPFVFKLHSPENFIVGGGFLARYSPLPVELAWEAFGQKNGAGSLEEMRVRIAKYRRVAEDPRESFTIGCIIRRAILLRPRSVDSDPAEFQASAAGKLRRRLGDRYRHLACYPGRLRGDARFAVAERRPDVGHRHWFADGGQGSFRVLVTKRMNGVVGDSREGRSCSQAAHIRPVLNLAHQVDNGILLRSDVHTLFDHGYLTVTPDHRVRVSRRLKKDFDNGEHYYKLDGSQLWIQARPEDRPKREFLEWHAETRFRR
jgi:putative restriction endonuclease